MPRRDTDALKSVRRFFAGVLPEPWDVRLELEPGREPERPYALIEQVGAAGTDGAPFVQDVTIAYTASLYVPRAQSRHAARDIAADLQEAVWQAVKVGANPARPLADRIPIYSYEPRSEIQRLRVRGATAGAWRIVNGADVSSAIAWNGDTAAVQAAVTEILPAQAVVAKRGGGIFDVMFIGELAGVDVDALEIDATGLTTTVEPTVTVILEGAPAPWRGPSDYMRVDSFGQTLVRDPDTPELAMVAVDLRCSFTRGPVRPWDAMLLQSVTAGCGG